MKAVAKVLDDPLASQRKRDSQLPYLRREVNVLLDLRGTLNVASFEVRRTRRAGGMALVSQGEAARAAQ